MEDIKRFWVRGSEEHPEAVKAALRHAGVEVYSLGCDNEHRIYFLGELGCEAWDDNSILADAIMTNPNWKELDITPFIKRDTKFEVGDYVICGDTCIGKVESIDSDGKYNVKQKSGYVYLHQEENKLSKWNPEPFEHVLAYDCDRHCMVPDQFLFYNKQNNTYITAYLGPTTKVIPFFEETWGSIKEAHSDLF